MTDLAIHSNSFSAAEIATTATVRIHLHQEVIRQVQVHHLAVAAAVPVHQEAAVVEVVVAVVAQVVRAEVATKSYT